jgi:glucuronokinase
MYGGKCISFTIDRHTEVNIEDAPTLFIGKDDNTETTLEYNGKHDLIKAVLNRLKLQKKSVSIQYVTHIPIGAGLAGSSAIIIATMRALNEHFKLGMDATRIAEEALHTEIAELGISCGFQDRYVIAHEGLLHMDFTGKEMMKTDDPPGKITRLDAPDIPWFLCLSNQPKTSASVHNPVRQRFLEGDTSIKEHMDKVATLADEGIAVLKEQDWEELGKLMNQNVALRQKIKNLLPHDKDMIDLANKSGALGAKLAGSGGAVLILADKPEVFDTMVKHYPCFKPNVVTP